MFVYENRDPRRLKSVERARGCSRLMIQFDRAINAHPVASHTRPKKLVLYQLLLVSLHENCPGLGHAV